MAQYWYKPEKRIKRISEDGGDRDVVRQVNDLKATLDKTFAKLFVA